MKNFNISVRKAGNNVVVNTKDLINFMYIFFEMNEVPHSAFECGQGNPFIVFSYHQTDDFKIVRYGLDKCVIIDVFDELVKDYPGTFSNMTDNIVYWI